MSTHLEKNIYLYLIISMVIWGVSWPSSKILTQYCDTTTLVFLKFFLSTLSMIPLMLILKQKWYFSRKLLIFLLLGALALSAYNGFLFFGLHIGYAGLGGVLVTTTNPVFTFILIALLEKIAIPKHKKIALFIGLLGGIIMLRIWEFDLGYFLHSGNLFFLLSSLAWSFATIISAKARDFMGSLSFTFYLYIISSFGSIFFVEDGAILEIFSFGFIFWANLLFTTVVSTGLATGIYFKASTIIGANNASSFIFLVPLVALFSSNILLGEIPNLYVIIGGCMAIFAVYLLSVRR